MEKTNPNYKVIPTTEANKIKLDQEGNIDKLKVRICVRGEIQKRRDTLMEDPHSPAASMRMSKMIMAEAARHKSRLFQLDVIGAFLQARMRSRVLIMLPKIYGEVFQEFKEHYGTPLLLLLKAMYGMTLSGKYWYEAFQEWLESVGFKHALHAQLCSQELRKMELSSDSLCTLMTASTLPHQMQPERNSRRN